MDTESKKKPISIPALAIGSFLLVAGLWAACYQLVNHQWKQGRITETGNFGDSFGTLDTLFSGLAFVGVLLALCKQHNDGLEAEERRRDDKKEEDAKRREAEVRHSESVAVQESVAKIQGFTALLNFDNEQYPKLLEAIHFVESYLHIVNRTRHEVGGDNVRTSLQELEERKRKAVIHISLSEKFTFDQLFEAFAKSVRLFDDAFRRNSHVAEEQQEKCDSETQKFREFLTKLLFSLTAKKEGLLGNLDLYKEHIADLLYKKSSDD